MVNKIRCEHCNSTQIRYRLRQENFFCQGCGRTTTIKIEDKKEKNE